MRGVSLGIGLVFLLAFTGFGVVLNVPLVRGNGTVYETIYVRASGAVEGTTKIVTGDNVVYTFTENINGSIIVERDNIVIDGADYTLQGDGGLNSVGIELFGRTNVTIQNTQIVNFQDGVWLKPYSNNNSIIENTFVDNDCAIELGVSSYNNISENIMTDNGNGIWLDTAIGYGDVGSNYNIISGNNITLCFWDAIGLANNSSDNTIIDNNMTNNQYAITISGPCSDNIVSGNFVDETTYGWGVCLEYHCNRTIVRENTIRNTGYGIYLTKVSYNNITENNVENSDIGVYFYKSSDNKFWHNNFIDNTVQVHISDTENLTNIWNEPYPIGGNRWSDYTGVDGNGDHIGDTPYIIDDYNIDHYPYVIEGFSPVEELSFNVTVDETDYVITTFSNSTVSNVEFNQTLKQLSFSVEGPTGTTGFCNITVPAELMSGDFSLYLDDVALVEGVDYIESYNGTHYLFSITYVHSSHTIELVSTTVVPDFAVWMLLPFFMAATLFVFTVKKKLEKQQKGA